MCDAFDIPVLNLIDCPGIMVGPDVERTALVRHCTRLFNVGANMTAPLFTVVVRKAYGLGAQAMLRRGLAGRLLLGGLADGRVRRHEHRGRGQARLSQGARGDRRPGSAARRNSIGVPAIAYDNAKAVNAVAGGGIDDVIDPADTRSWIANGLKRLPPVPPRTSKKYPYIDPW